MYVTEHVHRRLNEEAPGFVLEDWSRPRAQPQHVSRELDRGQVGGVLFRGLFYFIPLCFRFRLGSMFCVFRLFVCSLAQKLKNKDKNKKKGSTAAYM